MEFDEYYKLIKEINKTIAKLVDDLNKLQEHASDWQPYRRSELNHLTHQTKELQISINDKIK